MKAYKGFDKDMKCRGYQFESGKEYTEEKADICNCGFHACESPLDVLGHYAPGEQSRYCEVELDANDQTDTDSKRVGKHIKIGAEIGIAGLVKAHLEYVNEKIEDEKSNTGNCGASSNTGYRGSAEAGHPNSIAVTWGPEGKAKGVKGAFLVFAEWNNKGGDPSEENTWSFAGAKMVQVDGEKVKADTWYMLKNGEVEEVENEN